MEKAVHLEDIYRELRTIEQRMVTKEELAQIIETVFILSNPETMEQIDESERAIRSGKVKKLVSLRDL
jgi:PHD/YefM family antitoxin component YafN of YafNO toxin-antitoxin module